MTIQLQSETEGNTKTVWAVMAGALGYFVDIYDLSVFSITRQQSLLDLGVRAEMSSTVGATLYYYQLVGLALGGIIWGIIGDKKGRIRILYYSIILYSVTTWLNGSITTLLEYKLLRLFAGVGLAGELGAGVTLVSEFMNAKYRGYGAMVIASLGCIGVILAVAIEKNFGWRSCYQIGGSMGIVVLLFRLVTTESSIYRQISTTPSNQKGNLSYLLKGKGTLIKYILLILAGAPIYFVVGVLLLLTPEFGKGYNLTVTVGTATIFFYVSNTISDLASPFLSQLIRSRRKTILIFLLLTLGGFLFFFFSPAESEAAFYFKYSILGVGIGYWATLLTYISEQFGTNFRATATTSIPNFIRALAIPLLAMFTSLRSDWNTTIAGLIVGFFTIMVAVIAVLFTRETFAKDLNFQEMAK